MNGLMIPAYVVLSNEIITLLGAVQGKLPQSSRFAHPAGGLKKYARESCATLVNLEFEIRTGGM